MERRILVITTGVLICLMLFSGISFAQIREGSFSITPQLGGYLFEGNQDLGNGFTFGLGAGYNFTRNLGAEFFFNYIDSESDTTGADVNGYLYRLDGLYHFMPDNRLVPYIAAGLGGITLDPDNGGNDTSFIVNYGGGVKYFLTDSITLRGDLRHVISVDDTDNNLIYTVAVDFLFGGKKKAVPAVVTPVAIVAPPPPEPDSDGDGVVDSKDKCPGTPKGVTVNSSGCPLESDGDGVYDYLDKCPGTPRDLKVDANGCPIALKKTATIDLDIQFDSNKANIKPQYHSRLKKVADFMATYPETRALIEGHTDSVGSVAYNQKLSQRRSESVRDYLIRNFNISPNRLIAKGFGEERPVASNDTDEGRRKNRRIQAVFNAETEIYQKK